MRALPSLSQQPARPRTGSRDLSPWALVLHRPPVPVPHLQRPGKPRPRCAGWMPWMQAGPPPLKTSPGQQLLNLIPPPRRAFCKNYLRLAGTDHAFDTDTTAAGSGLDGLPLTIHQNSSAPVANAYAIFLSGDGGWGRTSPYTPENLLSPLRSAEQQALRLRHQRGPFNGPKRRLFP